MKLSTLLLNQLYVMLTDVNSFQTVRSKRAESGDVIAAAAVGTAAAGPIGGAVAAVLCWAFCSGESNLLTLNSAGCIIIVFVCHNS